MRNLKVLFSILGVTVWCLLPASFAEAQAVAGSQVSGIVRDSSGGALPGAEVTIVKTDTGAVRTVFTGEDGSYVIPNLPVGPYQLKVVLQGFTTYVQDGIVLQVNTNPQMNVTLAIGAVSEQVTVTANTTMVESHSTGIGQVVDNQRVIELPLNGRQATELIFLAGLATSAPGGDLNTNKNYPTVTISVAGGQANGMTYIMDGGTHNDPFNNLNLPTPFPDALQEFKVETSALPARYGHHAASAVNIVTKSGTNNLKGSAFEFNRNYRFNARNAFALERDSLKRNQFGGVLGGPVLQNKVFFFGGYQGKIERTNPSTTISYVPTQAMLNGDFTTFTSAACTAGRPVNLTGGFNNNQIDPSRLSPVALNFAKYLPASADPCGRVQYGIPNNNTEHQSIGKVDYTLSNRQNVFGRYLYAVYENPATFDGKNVLTLSRTGQKNEAHSVVVGHNLILSTSLINALRVTYNKTLNDRPLPEFFTATDLGSKVFSPLRGYMGINVSGNGFSVGSGGTNPGYFNSDSYQVADDVDFVRGDHQLSFGANWIHTKIETLNNRPTNGQFSFNGQGTGLPLADFMLGIVSGGVVQGNPVYDYDNHDYVGGYVQDDWRVRSNLSLNLGVRWEPFIPVRNTFGWVSHFDKARFDQGLRSNVYPQAPAGLIFPGDDGYPGKGSTEGKLAQFAPRVGAIWTPGNDQRTSIRAAWGIFYDTPHLFFNTRFANNPPWGAQITIPNPAGGWADPYLGYPGGNPFPALNDNWQTAAFPAFGVYVDTPLDLQPTALHQWNVSAQRQFGEWLVAASYLGNHSVHLWRATELNPAVYGPGATTGNTNQRRVLIRQSPIEGQYYGTIGHVDDTGRGNYNGLLLSAQRRLKGGLSVLSNWTLSKCMSDPATTEITGPTITDPNNPDLDYSYCASDRRHVINVSVVARTPQFDNKALNVVLGDWQVSPLVRWQSGNRSSVTTGVDNALSGMGGQRAVQILDDPYGDGTAGFYLNRAAFTSPDPGTYSALKPFSVVNPSRLQDDLAVTRTFRAGTNTVQFRWEVFNVINKVNLNAPTTALNSANFGKILGAGDPRIMQFALKVGF
ncbi:MAG TPA: carboxypeptidase regulatory-like domain-containing protein [Vicinamibacterales bacterium]|nr:carboxypeptidase regulatory-like domain-containing protein [Vicinamibacterales bacterium]